MDARRGVWRHVRVLGNIWEYVRFVEELGGGSSSMKKRVRAVGSKLREKMLQI